MVFINNGQEEITAEVATKFVTAQWGTDSTLETVSDTGLGTAVADTDNTVTKQISNNTIQTIHNTGVLEGNGSTLVEFANKSSTGTLNRKTTVPLVKDNTKRIVSTTTVYIDYS